MRAINCILLALLSSLVIVIQARAEWVEESGALQVAQNYVKQVISQDGGWGSSPAARVLSIAPFRRGDRVLGYYCAIEPVGYLVISPYRELAPVRAYSTRFNLDPTADSGTADFLKLEMERLYRGIEQALGRSPDRTEDFSAVLPVQFRTAWDILTASDFDPALYRKERRSRGAGMDYQEGDTQVLTTWSQEPPYNDDCPDLGCDWTAYDSTNTNALVGCVATAGAQVLKYWNWPPEGEGSVYSDAYDWPNMCDTYYRYSGCFRDGSGQCVTQAQIDAVAEISAEVGQAVGMDYGCDASGAYTADMEGVYQNHYRYDTQCDVRYRDNYGFNGWFDLLKTEFNANRVVQYRIPGHSIVSDGWNEEQIGDNYYWIHLVYGWNGGNDGWFSPNEIPGGDPGDEWVVREIYPLLSLGSVIDGAWGTPSYPHRYFDRDASSSGAAFAAGHNLHILRSGFLLTNTGTTSSNVISFLGAPYAETKFYLNGDPAAGGRIRVRDGEIRVLDGGQMTIR
jgi:hypothetical protein